MALTPEQQAALNEARARLGISQSGDSQTQRIRSAAQGLTFNLSDEAEAAVVSAVTGRPVEDVQREIRSKISAYRQSRPTESMLYEMAGASIPAAVATIATRSPAPATAIYSNIARNIGRASGIGAAEGAASTIGAMEQPISERFQEPSQIALGAGLGGVASGGLYAGLTGAVKGVDVASEAGRIISGSRARNAVQNEVQRIAEEAGITVEDAMQRLARGEIIAEDPNVALAIRPMIGAGQASTVIREVMTDRPPQTRRQAIETIRSGVAAGFDRNIVRQMRADDRLLRDLENREYKNAFQAAGDAPQEVVNQMFETISRFPSAGEKLKSAFKSETGRDPFFVVDDKGVISFRMLPTMRDAELLRRIVSDESRRLVSSGGVDATIGINLGSAERNLRSAIDSASPEISTARTNASIVRARNENYRAGKKATSRNADEIEVEFQDVLATRNPSLIQAYRLGYLESLNAKMQGGNKASVVARLSDPESKEGMVFRTIYPGDLQEAALSRLDVAAQSEAAARSLLRGSSTAPTQQAAQRIGMISQAAATGGLAVDALSGDYRAAANILDRVISQFRPNLTDAQKAEVARILLSQDPQIVSRALQSREGLRSLQYAIIPLAQDPAVAASLVGSQAVSDEISGR